MDHWAPGWQLPPEGFETVIYTVTTDAPVGTQFPFGCRWCGFSTKYDTVEICDTVNGPVHADCHQKFCTDTRCAEFLCTEERCDDRAPCDDCGAMMCITHSPGICYC